MRKSKTQRRVIASLMTGVFMLQQTMALSVFGSEISGFNQTSGVFNIDPTAKGGGMGFRQYEKFNLSQGDIANLNFADINTFVNLVDNQININGIVNTVRGNAFYNGRAVFISPNGMVVGASGVLNVGSLGAYSPDSYTYNQLKKNQTAAGFENFVSQDMNVGGAIKINGKIVSAGDVDLRASSVDIAKNAIVAGGVNESKMQKIDSESAATVLFNNLVNTDNLNTANSFASDGNGHIIISAEGIGTGSPNDSGLNIEGTVKNFAVGTGSSLEIRNYDDAARGLKISGTVANANGRVLINNNEGDLNISGTVKNGGNTDIFNIPAQGNTETKLNITGNVDTNGKLTIRNKGKNGMYLAGSLNTKGDSYVENGYPSDKPAKNQTAGMNISGTFNTSGNAEFYNTSTSPDGMNISGKVNVGGKGTFTNDGAGGLNVQQDGQITTHTLDMLNTGANGINIEGSVANYGDGVITNAKTGVNGININGTVANMPKSLSSSQANIPVYLNVNNEGENGINITGAISAPVSTIVTTDNTGAQGTFISSTGTVTGKDVNVKDNSSGGTRVQGLINASRNVNMTQKGGGNVVIGDKTSNNNYVTAGKDIAITITDGSLLNYGVEKVLLNAGGNLTMNVTDGTIGLPVQQAACVGSGCTGIGPKADGSRDFTKSVNANVKGKVKAETNKVTKPDDLVINYAAIDSDMNIDTIKADGRVILTVDDDYGYNNSGTKRYNMINARTDNKDTNIEGTGISLISNGSIGTQDKAVTFIQTGAQEGYSMDVLAENNINLKENSFNDSNYGRTKEVTTNKACTIIARKGDANIEFAGNTTIENITAEGDLTVVTRGKTLEIKNLGHITDESVIPRDYLGPRDYGQKDGGYKGYDYRDEALPNHATVKALDINHNIRPTEELVDGGHEAWAGSTVKIQNAVLDKGTLDITADHVYANGVVAHFGKEGYSKKADFSTNKVKGVYVEDGPDIPTGHAVRPDDVEDTGRNELERNYYYPNGDGDGTFSGEQSNVDPDDGIVDATPLEITDAPTDPPTEPPTDPPTEPPTDPPTEPPTDPPTEPPTDPPTEPPTDPPTEPPTDPPTEPPTDPPTEPPTDPPTEPPTDPPTEPPTDPPTEPPTDPPTDPPTEPPTDPPTEPPTDPPTEPPTDPPTEPPTDPPTEPPTDPPTDPPTEPPTEPPSDAPSIVPEEDQKQLLYNNRIDDDNLDTIDKRQYVRFNVNNTPIPVSMERVDNVDSLIDVSRGGVALKHNNTLKTGDIVPIHLKVGDLDIRANAEVVTSTTSRAGAKFINLDQATANQLLYMNMLLDNNHNLSSM